MYDNLFISGRSDDLLIDGSNVCEVVRLLELSKRSALVHYVMNVGVRWSEIGKKMLGAMEKRDEILCDVLGVLDCDISLLKSESGNYILSEWCSGVYAKGGGFDKSFWG